MLLALVTELLDCLLDFGPTLPLCSSCMFMHVLTRSFTYLIVSRYRLGLLRVVNSLYFTYKGTLR